MGKILTLPKLAKILEISESAAGAWLPHLDATMDKYSINSKLRISAWIAQVGHESGRLKIKEENLNYSAAGLRGTFSKYFSQSDANLYARQPEKIANRTYSNRMGNKNEASGDGWKFRGRGLIQVTGMENYQQCSKALNINLLDNPDALLENANAAMSAGWFWSKKGLNQYADRKDFDTTTKRINGGLNGKPDRDYLYQRALKILSDEDPETPKDKAAEIEPDKTTTISREPTPIANKRSIGEPAYAGGKSSYPNNRVYESVSGHIVEFDDTPGEERIHVYHRAGTYISIDSIGNYTLKTAVDYTEIISGDSSSQIKGDDTTNVEGQFYTKAGGDAVLKSGGTITLESPDKVQVNAPLLTFDEEVNGPTANIETVNSTMVSAATVSAGLVTCGMLILGAFGGSFSDSIDLGGGGGGGGGQNGIAADHVTIKKDVVNNKNSHTEGSTSLKMPLTLGSYTDSSGTQVPGVPIQGFIDTVNGNKIEICYFDENDGSKWKRIKDDSEYTGPKGEIG